MRIVCAHETLCIAVQRFVSYFHFCVSSPPFKHLDFRFFHHITSFTLGGGGGGLEFIYWMFMKTGTIGRLIKRFS